ncbi:MAG: transposase [Hyphomicrobiales bacterium]|nr:transposase [Hyphomicrobiales bacterium]
MVSIAAFLEGKLRLKVNRTKSAVAPVGERSFLGHRLWPGGRLGLAPKSLERLKQRLRRTTRRNRGIALERMVGEVNSFTTGWVTYFRHAACKEALRETDEWLRRKLRCVRLKQCKRAKPIADFLGTCGVPARRAWLLAASGKGWWRRSGSPPATAAMTVRWFAEQGLVNLQAHHAALQPAGNRRVR